MAHDRQVDIFKQIFQLTTLTLHSDLLFVLHYLRTFCLFDDVHTFRKVKEQKQNEGKKTSIQIKTWWIFIFVAKTLLHQMLDEFFFFNFYFVHGILWIHDYCVCTQKIINNNATQLFANSNETGPWRYIRSWAVFLAHSYFFCVFFLIYLSL